MNGEITLKDLPLNTKFFLHKIHSNRKLFNKYEFILEAKVPNATRVFWKEYEHFAEIFRGFL